MFLILQQSHFYGITTEMQSSCFLNLPSSAGFMTFLDANTLTKYKNHQRLSTWKLWVNSAPIFIQNPALIFTQILEADGLGGLFSPLTKALEGIPEKNAILKSPK